ncbi:hypothetical protein MJ524_18735 [Escherichia coli]|nr:hypothetical protein MJ524_18735 [Escherichia coli]
MAAKLSPAAPLPAPQTHYHRRWTPLNVASIDHPLTFSFSAGTLARSDELAQYGIIHDPHASSRLMIVEESEDTLALAGESDSSAHRQRSRIDCGYSPRVASRGK